MTTHLENQNFGRLIVTRRAGSQRIGARSQALWECACSCGQTTFVTTNNLNTGTTRSCGCLMRETSSRIAKEHPLKHPTVDISGQRSGLLVAIRPLDARRRNCVVWRCRCDCGREVEIPVVSFRRNKSCGCTKGKSSIRHGHALQGRVTREFITWASMHARCSNPNARRYARYGGRGITVCERWKDFAAFYADMGARPPHHSLDRIDNDGHYSPENCRWATWKQQNRNTRANHKLTLNGITDCIAGWAERTGIPPRRIASRLCRGWTVERALTTHLQVAPSRSK